MAIIALIVAALALIYLACYRNNKKTARSGTESVREASQRCPMPLVLALLAVVLSLAACSKSTTDIAGKQEVVPQVSPGALPALPQGIEGTTVTIANARFETEQLVLQVNQPTVLLVVNHDNRAYRLRIDQLVDGQPIAAATTTRVGFTTPKVGTYAGHLLEATNDTTLASLRVVVEAPSGATHR